MTQTVMPPEMLEQLKPEAVVPLVAFLCSDKNENESGQIFEAGAGWYAKIRFQRTKGVVFKTDDSFTPSAVRRVPSPSLTQTILIPDPHGRSRRASTRS